MVSSKRVVVTVGNDEMQVAQEAAAWAMMPQEGITHRTNWAKLTEDACRAASELEPGGSILLRCPGVRPAHWPCLSRLLIMWEPELSRWIHPAYKGCLDKQDGMSKMQELYRRVTGNKPAARSWMHAREQFREDMIK